MHINKFLFVVMLFFYSFASGQKIKNQSTFRMLQTANTLVEAQQFDAADEFFKKGLSIARATKDIYCEAYANQGMGSLYIKTQQNEKAILYYQQAVKLYKSQGLTVIADIVETLLKSAQGIGDLYAGVEIGAKGIKLSIIEVMLSKDREFEYSLKSDTSINTDAASLSYQSEKETSNAISILYNIIKRYAIPSKKIHIVISSGLKQELDKYNKVDYFANVIRPKELDTLIKVQYVTPQEEALLSFLGIVPQKNRLNTDQLDVGSGNTKGGYYSSGNEFIPITFPLGTKSFQRLIEEKTQGDINDFANTATQIWKDSLHKKVISELENKKEFKSRNVLYLSGGIVWAIASIMHPGSVNNNYVELTGRDISEFRRLIYTNYETVTKPDITLISNAEDARASQRNINRVLKTYDHKALLAGAIWLDELINEVNTLNPSKKFIYPKYAYVGWISGYIIKKATNQYTGLVK
ncbi:MAG: hypothetical protein WKF35_03670 [Ferruginibacter sp.]